MSLRVLALFAFAVLTPGCIPVAEPVGDIDKAEPDKALVGKWTVTQARDIAKTLGVESVTVSAPEVKGNPKGLMLASMKTRDSELPMWFFTTTVGKHTYVNVIVGETVGHEPPKFDTEGAFAEWKKEKEKRYFIFKVVRDGDKLTLDCGNNETFAKVMKDAGIKDDGAKHIPSYFTPAGWLAKYLDKSGPDKLFDAANDLVLTREKK